MFKSAFSVESERDSPGFLLWQTTITWQRQIKKTLERQRLNHSQFVLLAILLWFEKKNIPATQTALISWSKLDKMTVSKSLRTLANEKLVKRTEHPTDSRAKFVELSQIGRITAVDLVFSVEDSDAEFFGSLTDSERKTLNTLLHKLVKGQDEKTD
jgi:DNA-binding MarR family transcriptional regulator